MAEKVKRTLLPITTQEMYKTVVSALAVAVLCVHCLACSSLDSAEPNTTKPNPSGPKVLGSRTPAVSQTSALQRDDTSQQLFAEVEKRLTEFKAHVYEKTVGHVMTALAIIATSFVVFVGYAIIRRERDCRKALDDAKAAAGEAKEMTGEVRNLTREARDSVANIDKVVNEKLATIDEMVKRKLKDIEKLGSDQFAKLAREAEKERQISEKWSEGIKAGQTGDFKLATTCFREIADDPEVTKSSRASAYYNWGCALSDWGGQKKGEEADQLFTQACEKYQKAVEMKPDFHEAYHNWANALAHRAHQKEGDQAEQLFTQACQKCQKAVEIKPDFRDAYHSWGSSLLDWARKKTGKRREELLRQAKEKYLEAETIEPGSACYNLACISALLGDKAECRKWLEAGGQAGTLPSRGDAMKHDDLASVRDEAWFKALRFNRKP